MRALSILLVASAMLGVCGRALAADVTWPGATCASTLQACIASASDGDVIQIATGDPIDENIELGDHAVSLVPAVTLTATYQPRFAPGRSIHGSATAGSIAVTLRGLHFVDGSVALEYHGTGSANYVVNDLSLTQSSSAADVSIRIRAYAGTVTASAYHNRIVGNPAAYGGSIELLATDAVLNAYASFNYIEHRSFELGEKKTGIQVAVAGASTSSSVRLFGNEILLTGSSSAGITFKQDSTAASSTLYAHAYTNVVRCRGGSLPMPGLSFVSSARAIEVQAMNNTIDGCPRGIVVETTPPVGAPTFSGLVWNNVVVAPDVGLTIDPLAAAVANDYNLVNAPSNPATLGAHSITAPAQLDVAARPRLAAGSPGIDAADGTTLANGIIDNGFPILDADGLRRIKGARADIGAYEYGDLSFTHVASAANTNAHVTTLTQAGITSTSLLLPTRRAAPTLANSYEDFGVWLSIGAWTIYNEDHATAIAPGKAWNVFAPASGAGAFTHISTPANTSGWNTEIDNPATNGYADRIVLVRHSYSLDGSYDDHPVSVYVTGSGSSARWHIANADQQALPAGAGFNVYAQASSPNAFRVNAPFGANIAVVDHPLITQVACAALHVTRVTDPFAAALSTDFTVEFDVGSSFAGYWLIRSPVPFPANTVFDVVIDPGQVATCNDVIFANGFDPSS